MIQTPLGYYCQAFQNSFENLSMGIIKGVIIDCELFGRKDILQSFHTYPLQLQLRFAEFFRTWTKPSLHDQNSIVTSILQSLLNKPVILDSFSTVNRGVKLTQFSMSELLENLNQLDDSTVQKVLQGNLIQVQQQAD